MAQQGSSKDNTIVSKVEETVKDEVRSVGAQAKAAAQSGAYLYPLKGILYLFTHRDLWKPLFARLVPTLGLGVAITTGMFLLTYVPQLAILVFTQGPLAAITTVLLVLSESSTLTTILAKTLLIQDSLVDTFDGTLVAKGQEALVKRERTVKGGGAGDVIARLGKLVSTPFQKFTPSALIRYLMFLPLNFIPVVGTAVFVTLQGRRVAPSLHERYFQLKGMGKVQRDEFVEARKGAYTRYDSLPVQKNIGLLTMTLSFGIASVLLEMVPVAGIIFNFTNTCGAALWAADMEKASAAETNAAKKAY